MPGVGEATWRVREGGALQHRFGLITQSLTQSTPNRCKDLVSVFETMLVPDSRANIQGWSSLTRAERINLWTRLLTELPAAPDRDLYEAVRFPNVEAYRFEGRTVRVTTFDRASPGAYCTVCFPGVVI